MSQNSDDDINNEIESNDTTQITQSNRSHCKYCHKKIHASRDILGIYSNCKKRKFEHCPAFSFEEGSKRALTDSNFVQNQAMKYAELAGCQPMKIDLFTTNTGSSTSLYYLTSNEAALNLTKNIKFLDGTVSDVFSGRISFSRNQNDKIYNGQQIADKKYAGNKINNDTDLQMSV